MPLVLTILQLAAAAAAPAPAVTPLPDIELHARIRAKSITIEQRGETRLEVHAEPSAGQTVEATGKLPPGTRQARNLDVRLDAHATIADPRATRPPPAADPPGG